MLVAGVGQLLALSLQGLILAGVFALTLTLVIGWIAGSGFIRDHSLWDVHCWGQIWAVFHVAIPFILGVSLGIIGLWSWIITAPIGLALLALARFGWTAENVLRWHPLAFDEQAFWPIPGWRWLVRQTLLAGGQTWLMHASAHPAYARPCLKVLEAQAQTPIAHELLWALSSSTAGTALLSKAAQQLDHPPRLLVAYEKLANASADNRRFESLRPASVSGDCIPSKWSCTCRVVRSLPYDLGRHYMG